jgi:hypothetical protein
MDITEIRWRATETTPPYEVVVPFTVLRLEDYWPEVWHFGQLIAEKAVKSYFTGEQWNDLLGVDTTEYKLRVEVTAPTPAVGTYHVELSRIVDAVATRMTERTDQCPSTEELTTRQIPRVRY